MWRTFVLLLLPLSVHTYSAIAGKDTVSVFFRSNEASMTEGMRAQLDHAILNGLVTDRDDLWLIGYADEVGGSHTNLRLSRARAQHIKTYLVRTGFDPARIKLVDGKGELGAKSTGAGFPRDRRVDIVKVLAPAVATAVAGAAIDTPKKHRVQLPEPSPAAAVHIDLSSIKAGESIRLDAIYFEAGRHYFKTGAYETLNALYQSLVDHPNIRIKIEGHVCCTPEEDIDGEDVDTHKLDLSVNRALAVREYLVRKGINPNRMEYEGFGRRKPIVKVETTEQEAILNRRVEVRVIE